MSAALIGAPVAPDAVQIKRTIMALHGPDDIVELRAIHKGGRKRVDAGYFDGEHRDLLVEEAMRLNSHGAAVYITLNKVDPQLLARCANRVQEYASATATDANVTHRHWLLIDIDPQRPKDTSATDEQLALARERARAVYDFLSKRGWPQPVSADSGNGLHFLYRVILPNDEDSRDLVKNILAALAKRFNDDAIKIDQSVFNAARIVKFHGTVANKGDDLPAAPWRLSKLRTVPADVLPVDAELLRSLAAEVAPVEQKHNAPSAGVRSWSESDVQSFLARGGIDAVGPDQHEGVSRWKLKTCPFNPDHGFGEAAVFLRPDGRLGFECRHNSCQDKHWRDLRTLVDGDREQHRPPVTRAPMPVAAGEWPNPQPLPDGLPAVDAFDYELLPPILRRRVEDIAERMQCPPDFPAVAIMVMLSSLVGRRCGIAPKHADDWAVIPNLWGMVIGRPGIMKSPPLTEIMRPLQVLQARAIDVYNSAQAEHQAGEMVALEGARLTKDTIRKLLKDGKAATAHERAQEAMERDDAEPVCRRFVVNDSTVEKLGEILNQNPCGILLFRDELNGYFRTLERQGHEADRAFYLECWNGDNSFTYDRIGRGTLHIAGACLSVLGGIQPGPLADIVRGLRGSGDDGLLQRFQLSVWPDVRPEWRNVDRPPDSEARDAIQSIIERLDRLSPASVGAEPDTIPLLRFSSEAQQLFDIWREALERRLRGDTEHAMVEAHLAKYRSLVPSLALLIHLADADGGPVELLPLERAIAWAEYLESHARRIYAPAISPDMDAARLLARRIRRGELGDAFGLRDVYNNGWSGLSTRDEVAAAVAVMIDHDWMRAVEEPTPGRTRTVYRINPAVLKISP